MFTRKPDDNNLKQTRPPTNQETRGQIKSSKPPSETGSSPSLLTNDLYVSGNIKAEGDIVVEGRIEGDLQAKMIEIGIKAMVKGTIMADELIINGHVKGKLRGGKVRLNSSAKVEGDIINETLAIESGAYFDGNAKRKERATETVIKPNPTAEPSSRSATTQKSRFVPPQQKQSTQQK